jgi:hypothetical protein
MRRLGEDICLLRGVLAAFSFVSPDHASLLPENIKNLQAFPGAGRIGNGELERRRVQLLDSRPWFAAYQPTDKPLIL